jgi:hypothetical protein
LSYIRHHDPSIGVKNHPARAAAASKPVQLSTAARRGLTVPDTLITNEPSAVRRFAEKGATVTKMLGANHITEEGTRNSGGQFGWLEARTGAPLTQALADLLARGT